ncbi:MAG: twin-arginine translocase subunit TatC [Saprospiraceae bacterium]|nr:twin-arginine translocase subunit TatC [Saprospiraceae bacterium]
MLRKLSSGDQKPTQGEGGEMGFLDHIEELRWHIVKSIVAVFLFAIVAFVFESWVFENIIFAHKKESFITYQIFQKMGMGFSPADFKIITTILSEQFFTSLKVSFYLGLIVAFPYVFYQFWTFVKPGLYENEQKATKGVVFTCSILFLIGVAFGFIILAPFAIRFLGGYSVGLEVQNTVTISSYVGYLSMLTIPTGLIFQLPLLVFFLAKIGLVTPEIMRTYRKHAVVAIMILSAIITPPDPPTMFLISMPILLLYEISILIVARTAKKLEKELNS